MSNDKQENCRKKWVGNLCQRMKETTVWNLVGSDCERSTLWLITLGSDTLLRFNHD